MNSVVTQVELRLLTHRPEAMVAWWVALLDGAVRPVSARITAVTGTSLRVEVEHSQIALDYHPEASGVTAINLLLDDVLAVRQTLNRLARQGIEPHRATRNSGEIVLWLRDPNGTDVTVCLPAPDAHVPAEADALPEELDVKALLVDISNQTNERTHPHVE
jgi:hypothetical protein